MKRGRFSEEKIISILRKADGESTVKAVCAKYITSDATFFNWKRKYGGMDVVDARQRRALEDEDGWLKRLVACLSVHNQILKEVERQKMVSSSTKRRAAIKYAVEEGLGSSAVACRALGLP